MEGRIGGCGGRSKAEGGGVKEGWAQEPPRAGCLQAMDRRRSGGWQHPSAVLKEPGSRSPYEGIAYASSRDAGVRATIIHVNHII